jgi:hypothetical protein
MTRQQLEQLRDCVEAQTRRAVLHGGDQELLDLLRVESNRLSVLIGSPSRSPSNSDLVDAVPCPMAIRSLVTRASFAPSGRCRLHAAPTAPAAADDEASGATLVGNSK